MSVPSTHTAYSAGVTLYAVNADHSKSTDEANSELTYSGRHSMKTPV